VQWVSGTFSPTHEGSKSYSSELVFGAPLRVPGDFIATPCGREDSTMILRELREKVGKLAPVPTTCHGRSQTFVPPTLQNSQCVFVRRDSHRIPLQRPYEGPFKVIVHGDKVFKLDVGGRTEVASVDRLKPAHLDVDQLVSLAVPPCHGRPRTRLPTTPVPSSTVGFKSDICLPTRTSQAEKFVIQLVSSNFVTYSARGGEVV